MLDATMALLHRTPSIIVQQILRDVMRRTPFWFG